MAKYRPRTALTRRPIGGGQGPPPSARLTKYFADQEQQAERQQLQFKAGLATQTAIQAEGRAEERAIRTKGREAFRSKYGGGLDIEALPFGDTKEHFEVQQEKISSGELGFTSPTLQRRWDTLEQAHAETSANTRLDAADRQRRLEAIEEGMRPLIKMAKPTKDARDKLRAEQIQFGEEAAERGFFPDPETGIPVAFEPGGQDPEEAGRATEDRRIKTAEGRAARWAKARAEADAIKLSKRKEGDKTQPLPATQEEVQTAYDFLYPGLDDSQRAPTGGATADSWPPPPKPPPPSGKPAGPQHDDPFKDPQGRRWEPAIQ